MFIYPIYNHNWRNISTTYIYITRPASNEIFSPSNKVPWEVGWAKDLSAPQIHVMHKCEAVNRMHKTLQLKLFYMSN